MVFSSWLLMARSFLYIVQGGAMYASCLVAYHRRFIGIVRVFGLFFCLLHLSGDGRLC